MLRLPDVTAFAPRFCFILLWLGVLSGLVVVPVAWAQTVSVGAGSYSTSLPPGAVGPQNASGQNVVPKVAAGFTQPVQSNDFWSSLIYPFFGDPYSNILYAHPLNAKATADGLQIGYTTEPVFAAQDYLYPFSPQLTVGVEGMATNRAVTQSYGDWTVTAQWEGGPTSLEATLGHGLPYVFFEITGGRARIDLAGTPTIWSDDDGVLGLTVAGRHYGVFAPSGSVWTGSTTLLSTLDGESYLSVALLPDDSPATLELFRQHAYAFVTDSRIAWSYDEPSAQVTSTYTYDTVLRESGPSNVNETLTALYRHQWLHTPDAPTAHTYQSPRGVMRLFEGNAFTTELPFGGVLPALPDRGDYNREDLLDFVQETAAEALPVGPTYQNGKAMGRFSHLVHIADQLGATAERDHFLDELKTRLEDWLTDGGAQEYSYNDTWDVLTGYPSGFGADNQINDHHFHSAYAIMSAATVAQYDPAWAAQDQWGGMINLLIKDANNWERSDNQFPFLRTHDAYAGHSWAAGHGDFAEGNNQESSSESMNFATAVILWGEATGQEEIRDLGVFLHATEASAVEEYWFDTEDAVFPDAYPHVAIGIVWGGKGVHSTWFGADPEFIHGINILPVTGGSLYLGRDPDYVTANYDEIVAERNGQPVVWKDVLWQYLALSDPDRALSYYFADSNYEPFDGESRAHTLHWLFNLKKMGHVDTSIRADVPTYAVFRDDNDDVTYVAYNAGSDEREVAFSDGFSFSVAPRQLASFSTSTEDPNAPVVLLVADPTEGKAPLTVAFDGSQSFDPQGGDLSFLWRFGPDATSTEPDPTFTFTEVGEHPVTLTVTTEANLVARDSVVIRVLPNGTPYFGEPVEVPGTIEAENYDLGGEGIAYHDTEAENIGLSYRPDEGVDIEPSSTNAFDVYWITDGEWIEYTFEATATGTYSITPYVAGVPGFGALRMLIDNEDVSGRVDVPATGGWQTWEPLVLPEVQIEEGEHILRFEFESASDPTGWLFSMNYIDVALLTVNADPDGEQAARFVVRPNAPNPFSETTRIAYVLPEPGRVSFEVFNAIGQKVFEGVEENQSADEHVFEFDARGLPSGMYVCRVRTGAAVATLPMMVVR